MTEKKEIFQLENEDLEKVNGGMSQKEIIDHINNNWKIIPEDIRNKIIETYEKLGCAATYKLILYYIEKTNLDYLSPLLDLFR